MLEIEVILSNPIYKAREVANDMIMAVRKKQGYAGHELSELIYDIKNYWFMCLELAGGNFKQAKKYYKKFDVVLINQMNTDKLAREFVEPDITIQDEYKKITNRR